MQHPGNNSAPRLSTLLILFSVLTTGIGQSMTFALLPPLAREVQLSEVQTGLIVTFSALAFTLTSPVWGRSCDRHGRKPVLLIGLFGYTFGCALFATIFLLGLEGFISGLTLFALAICSRVLMAALMSATPSAASAYIADTTSPEQRVAGMGRLGAARTLGSILGPALLGVLAIFGLLTPLYIASGTTLVSTLLVIAIVKEPQRIVAKVAEKPRLKMLDKRYFSYILIGVVTFTAFSMMSQTVGFYFQDRFTLDSQATAQALGMGMMISALMSFIGQAFLVNRSGMTPFRLMNTGLPMILGAFLMVPFATSTTMVIAALGLLGLGLGMVSPGFSSGASLAVGPQEQGAVGGLISACSGGGFILGPVLGTSLYQLAPNLPYFTAAILMLPVVVYARRIGRNAQIRQS